MRRIENDNNGNPRVAFDAELLAVSNNTLTNSNGKEFKIVNIRFEDKNKEMQDVTAICYEGNYKYGIEVGNKYLTTATFVEEDNAVYLQMSHLIAGERADSSMFDFSAEFAEVPEEAKTAFNAK